MGRRTNRRQFIQQTGLAGIGFWVAGGISLGARKGPNDKLNIACIGVGGKGSSDTDHAGKVGNVVALCDIDDDKLNEKANRVGSALLARESVGPPPSHKRLPPYYSRSRTRGACDSQNVS